MPDFTLSEEQLAGYNPSVWFTSTEMVDTVAPLDDWPTEDDLEVLTNGIPVSHLPVLGRWPSGVIGAASPLGKGANGQSVAPPSESFAPAPNA